MNIQIPQLIEKFSDERHSTTPHCDITSSQVQMVSTPIPTLLFHELEAMASEYNRDINCMAGELLSAALTEALTHMSNQDKVNLDNIIHNQEVREAASQRDHCNFDAGGT